MTTLVEKLDAIGDAIRAKTGGSAKLTLDEMPDEIAGIGGGGPFELVDAPVTVAWDAAKQAMIDGFGFLQGANPAVAYDPNLCRQNSDPLPEPIDAPRVFADWGDGPQAVGAVFGLKNSLSFYFFDGASWQNSPYIRSGDVTILKGLYVATGWGVYCMSGGTPVEVDEASA